MLLVNTAKLPLHNVLPGLALMLIEGATVGSTVIVSVLLVAVAGVAHVADEVMMHDIVFPVAKLETV